MATRQHHGGMAKGSWKPRPKQRSRRVSALSKAERAYLAAAERVQLENTNDVTGCKCQSVRGHDAECGWAELDMDRIGPGGLRSLHHFLETHVEDFLGAVDEGTAGCPLCKLTIRWGRGSGVAPDDTVGHDTRCLISLGRAAGLA